MADIELQQANHLPGNSCSRSVLPQRQNYVRHDAGVSLYCHCILLAGAHDLCAVL